MVVIAAASATFAGIALAVPLGLVGVLRRLHGAVGLAPPTEAMAEEEDASACALFRHLPSLAPLLAWRSLGALRETPVHELTLRSPLSGAEVQFCVKREDLISDLYGGNKVGVLGQANPKIPRTPDPPAPGSSDMPQVRTLQHQLATCESRAASATTEMERAKRASLLVIGSGGSNQVCAGLGTLGHPCRPCRQATL